jgi:hypothetical protein
MVTNNIKGVKSAPLSYKEIIDVLGELPSIVREKKKERTAIFARSCKAIRYVFFNSIKN